MDEMIAAVKTCLRKYADFTGRAGRAEFWWFSLLAFFVPNILAMVFPRLGGLLGLGLLIPSFAVATRRLHDVNKSGWLQLLWLVPIFGWAVLIYLCGKEGDAATNQYGEPPARTPAARLA